jgi:hypothetical protein
MNNSDNSNNLLESLKNSVNNSAENISLEPSNSNSFFSWFKNISVLTWIIIIIVLAFFGINIFSYLSQGTQDITNFFSPIINSITSVFGNLTGQVVNVSAEGAKGVVNTTAGVTNAGLTSIQELSTNTGTPIQNTLPPPTSSQTDALNTALNTSTQPVLQQEEGQNYQADEANSPIQTTGSGKSGWCYIGEDHGIRTCGEVGVNDTCMSGDIFPTQEICINPSLRA